MIHYGILGFGHHGERRLAGAFAQTKNAALTGIWRRNQERAQQNAAEHSIEHVFASTDELCTSPAIDVVFVTSPDVLHCEHTLLAMRHGKAVLCEKPMAMNAEEAQHMAETARAAGLVLGVAQNFRYNRSLERIRSLVSEGAIGTPIFAACNFCFLSDKSPRTWIGDSNMACGGPIGDVGIHAIDALRFILQQEVAGVSTVAREGQPASAASARPLEESAAMTFAMSGGTLASAQVSFRAIYRTFVEVVGADGVLTAESGLTVDRPVTITHHAGGDVISQEDVSNADAYSRMLDAFSAAVEGKEAFRATGEDGIRNQQVLDAAFRSWHSGHRETIPA